MIDNQKEVYIFVNGRWVSAINGQNLLKAIRSEGIELPAACSRMSENPKIHCGICVVQIKGTDGLRTACTESVSNGMVVRTDTEEIERVRKNNLQLLFEKYHNVENCAECIWDGDCEFLHIAQKYGVKP